MRWEEFAGTLDLDPQQRAATARIIVRLRRDTSDTVPAHAQSTEAAVSEIEALLTFPQINLFRQISGSVLSDISADTRFPPDVQPPGFLCRSPYEYAHIQANGDVYPCCPSKFGKIIGNLTRQSLDEIWNSPEALETRASMIDGSYRFCNASACEYLRGAAANGEAIAPAQLTEWSAIRGLLEAGTSPSVVNFAFDRGCNLACNYCRSARYRPNAEDERLIATIDDNIFKKSRLNNLRRIVLLGEGDPFDSPFYLNKLRTYDWSRHSALRIKIQTNGVLLSPEMWQSIRPSHEAIDWISVSVDAASANTYRENRGANFNLLHRNLEFIANLRALGRIDRFCVNFLVLANNFHEMPAFARLGLDLGCDQIEFQKLENWGTFTEAQYRSRAVHEPEHVDHRAYLEVLEDPILTEQRVWMLKVKSSALSDTRIGLMSWDDAK